MLKLSPRAATNPGRPRQQKERMWRHMYPLRRCKTTLDRQEIYRPNKRYCESCTVDYIRRLQANNLEAEEKLKETIHVLGMQRSKSDLDMSTDSINRQNLMGTGLLRERSQIYLTNVTDHVRRETMQTAHKEEVKISKAVVPRKGLIQLTSTDASEAFKVEPRNKGTERPREKKGNSLIRRKDIMEQVRMGTKLLEESEQQKSQEEELSKSLGEYTILELQSKILEMTDMNNLPNRKSSSSSLRGEIYNKDSPAQKDKSKGVTLPAINNLKIF